MLYQNATHRKSTLVLIAGAAAVLADLEAMTKVDLWGNEIKQMPKEACWNIVVESLSDLNNAYNLRDGETNIPPQYRDSTLSHRVEIALDRLMAAYDAWLD